MFQPSADERATVTAWIKRTLATTPAGSDPGSVTIRRLNKVEYSNTVRDLLGVDFKGADDFPSDDVGYGFDNIGDVLSLSPMLMEKYLNAAEAVAREAIVIPEGDKIEYGADAFKFQPLLANANGEFLNFYTVGTATIDHKFKLGGHYKLRIKAFGDQAGPDPCKMLVTLDEQPIQEVTVSGRNPSEAAIFEIPLVAKSGIHAIGIRFTNDYYNAAAPNPHERDRNLKVMGVSIQGPVTEQGFLPELQQRLITSRPEQGHELEAARKLFRVFATRAFRRPATEQEVARLSSFVAAALKNGDSYEQGVQLGIEAALVSPSFLFRAEPSTGAAARPLTGYELASRLSYFLWSSMPDDALFKKAANGSLLKPAVLQQEVARMLKDPKADSLASNFATQWLTLRKLDIIAPDKTLFPEFSDPLRQDMRRETQTFFAQLVANDRSVLDLLTAKYSYMNGRLAKFYGISGVEGDEFRKVSLEGTPRAGVITQASVLTVTSNPTRTSPVKRGKWILEELLGTPPPPPPPGVGVLTEDPKVAEFHSVRERLEEHRKKPQCAVCHSRMDPLGFGLENFDAIGKWRTADGKLAIDSNGVLPDGRKFTGPQGLTQVLSSQKNQFVKCLAEKLMTYALGRGMTSASDDATLDHLVQKTASSNYRFSSLVEAITASDAFRKRGAALK